MHSSRLIAALAGAALLAGTGAVRAQTSAPATAAPLPGTMTMAPMTAAPEPAPTAAPPGAAASGAPTAAPPSAAPLPPVHTMAPRPLPGGPTGPGGALAPGSPALGARSLKATRTATGYVLGGEARVKDGCQAARFDPAPAAVHPPQFGLVQFRRPGSMGVMCMQMVRWIPAQPRTVTTSRPPAFVTVRTAAGLKRVPIR